MRKVTENTINAFLSGNKHIENNTQVLIEGDDKNKKVILTLFGNIIAVREKGKLFITNCGWFSNTTKERLNALPGVSIQQKKGKWYLNGNEWDGKLIEIKK